MTKSILTIAVVLDDVLHISAVFITQTQSIFVAVVLRERSQDGGLCAVVLAANHVVLAVFCLSALMPQAFTLGRAESITWCSEVSAEATQLVIEILHTRGVSNSNAICVRSAIFAFCWKNEKKIPFCNENDAG